MIEIPFDPNADALLFECTVEFQTIRNALMALDTGASTVTFSQEILESIGYDLDAVTERETFGNASCEHTVPKVNGLMIGCEELIASFLATHDD